MSTLNNARLESLKDKILREEAEMQKQKEEATKPKLGRKTKKSKKHE